VANIDTLEPVLVADNYPLSVAWSSDSRRLIFTSRTNNSNNNEDLYVVNFDGSSLINLTNSSASELDAEWSPDGQHIAFTSNANRIRQLYIMRADGSEVRPLSTFNASNPAWSPDGESIVFLGWNPDENAGHIYKVDVDTGNLTRLTDNPRIYADPIWSPDGNSIAFVTRREGEVGLYVMAADGSSCRRLLSSDSLYTHSWSPDGRWIAFFDPEGLHVINTENAHIVEFEGSLNRNLFWSSAGEQILSLNIQGVRVDSPKTIETYDLSPAS
jgi:TolB protein